MRRITEYKNLEQFDFQIVICNQTMQYFILSHSFSAEEIGHIYMMHKSAIWYFYHDDMYGIYYTMYFSMN